jgi:hypothetical protein
VRHIIADIRVEGIEPHVMRVNTCIRTFRARAG